MSFLSGLFKPVKNIIGDITGSTDASNAQVGAANAGIAEFRRENEQSRKDFDPFRQLGLNAIPQFNRFLDPNQVAQMESSYQNSASFKQLADQARNQQLASAEATGGLGGSAIQNSLAAIAPQLTQNYMDKIYGRTLDALDRGQSATAQTAQSGSNATSSISQLLQQRGSAQAGGALAPFKDLLGAGKVVAGAASGGLF